MSDRISRSRLFAQAVLVTPLAAALLISAPAEAARPDNDGRWSVEVVTDKGDCDRAYRYAIQIENNQPRYGGSEPIAVTGRIAANGSLRGMIAYGENRANVSGRLAGGWGSGSWTFNGSRTCSGHWNAERRG